MRIQESVLLAKLTTFKIGGPARFFVEVATLNELAEAIAFAQSKSLPILVLGGASNTVISDSGFDGVVIGIKINGFEVLEDNDTEVLIKIAAGENWDQFVERAVANRWWGIENLSNIPGLIGGFAMQNVGAYGQEASQVIESVEVLEISSGQLKNITNAECQFGYRSSVFNTKFREQFVILSITLRLKKKGEPNLSYADVKKHFDQRRNSSPSIEEIRAAIIEIRKNKFPDLTKVGNAGSFFKNLILSNDQFRILSDKIAQNFNQENSTQLQEYKNKFFASGGIKVPTAFLIDICGLKGMQLGGAKVWEVQPLAIVNDSGQAKALDVLEVFKKVRQTVYAKTGMLLAPEPEFVGFSKQELEKYFDLSHE